MQYICTQLGKITLSSICRAQICFGAKTISTCLEQMDKYTKKKNWFTFGVNLSSECALGVSKFTQLVVRLYRVLYRPVCRWSLYWCIMIQTPLSCRPWSVRGQDELSHNILNLRIIQVLSNSRKFGTSVVGTWKFWYYGCCAEILVLVKYFHATPDTQKSSIFQMFMTYLFRNLSSISTGNLPFWYLFSWSLTWLKVR